jgi:hypothetical protein
MVSATNANCLRVNPGGLSVERANVACAAIERGGLRTIGEVLAEMLPRYARIVGANSRPADGVRQPASTAAR